MKIGLPDLKGGVWLGLVMALLLAKLPSAHSAEWYVAADAGFNGEGSFANPWALQVAIDRITPIRPGDVLWLRGGIYQSNYLSYLTGEPNRYIVVRPWQGERVVFDGSPLYPDAFPLTIEGAWTIYRDFEVMHSATWGGSQRTPVAIQCIAPNVKLVNLVIHDAGQGVGFWKEAIDSEIYGCILYYNGADSQEHGIYTQNDVGVKRIRDSIVFHNSGYGIHAYAQNGYARNYDIEGNFLFQNGLDNGELFVGSFFPTDNLNVISNYSLAMAGLREPVFRLNDRDHGDNPNGSANVRGNYIVGGAGFAAQDFRSINFSNNFVLSTNLLTYCRPPPGGSLGAYHWNVNRYAGVERFQVDQDIFDFPSWLGLSSLDGLSIHSAAPPTGIDVFVRPNLYEKKRANIAIYNWAMSDNVVVNVSNVLKPGDDFELRNVEDYLGPVVLRGVFPGGPLLVPMTNLAVALPGRAQAAPAHAGPFFGAFVISSPYRAPHELMAHWTFDEGMGAEAIDSARGLVGALVGNPRWVQGVSGQALEFDGTDDLVNIPDAPSLDPTNDVSISFWFKPSELMNGSIGRRDLLAKYISFWVILNYPFNDGRLTFGFNSGAPYVRSTTASWTPDKWYHLVGAFDGIVLKLYIDGQLEGSTPTTFRVMDTAWSLQVGGNNVQNISYKGAIDDLRLYNYALSPEEIADLHTNLAPVNIPPTLTPLVDREMDEGQTLAFQVVATDLDSSANPLTFAMEPGAPAGARVDSQTGWFSFSPTEEEGPALYTIGIRVHDNDTPSLSAVDTFTITVREVNSPPVLAPINNRSLSEQTPLVIDLQATDPDVPLNKLSYSLRAGAPSGLVLNENSGRLVWVPNESQGPSTNVVRVAVTDDGVPPYTVERAFLILVNEVNQPPHLPFLPVQSLAEGSFLVLEAGGTDPDYPVNHLTYALEVGAPAGVLLNPTNGKLSWSPAENQGPQMHTFGIRVTDDGFPPLSSTGLVRILVTEINQSPRLAPISNRHATEGVELVIPLSATDEDWPANALELSLDPGAPLGAAIDPGTQTLRWIPAGASGVYPLTARVRDNGVPPLSSAQSFTVTVHPVPRLTVAFQTPEILQLTWSSAPGTRYRIALKSALSDPAWISLPGEILAQSTTTSVEVSRGAPVQRFYRILVVD